MPHIVLFLLLVIFLASFAALLFVFYTWRKTASRFQFYFFFFLITLLVKILLNYILLYFKINLENASIFQFVLYSLSDDISYLILFLFPLVFHSIYSLPKRRLLNGGMFFLILIAALIRFLPYLIKILFPEQYFAVTTFHLPEALAGLITLYILILTAICYRKLKDLLLKRIALAGTAFYLFVLLDTYYIHYVIFMNSFYSILIWPIFLLYAFWIVFLVLSSRNAEGRGARPQFTASVGPEFIRKYALTEKETELVNFVITGKSNREIAETLFLSVKTVKNHIYNIYQKTGVKSRLELTLLAGKDPGPR